MNEAAWRLPPKTLKVGRDEIHVWRAGLERNTSYVQSLQQILSADEQARAGRFYFQKDRQHFIVARGLLRVILSRYLDMEPSQLGFCYSPYGKPSLLTTSNRETLSFNLSHSCGLALYAITRGRQIGIDLERIRTDFACEPIAEQFFSPRENAMLSALPTQMKHKAFFNCWTGKEAYIKARGEGLSLPLNQFDVSLTLGLSIRKDPQEASRWSLQELNPGPGYVAALAASGKGWRLKCWQWPGWSQPLAWSQI